MPRQNAPLSSERYRSSQLAELQQQIDRLIGHSSDQAQRLAQLQEALEKQKQDARKVIEEQIAGLLEDHLPSLIADKAPSLHALITAFDQHEGAFDIPSFLALLEGDATTSQAQLQEIMQLVRHNLQAMIADSLRNQFQGRISL